MSQEKSTYDFYYAIYNLRNPSSKVMLGNSTIFKFDDLPKRAQRYLVSWWKNYFQVYREWARTEDELVERKKTSTFLHLKVKARTPDEARKSVLSTAKDAASILSFLYGVYFPVHLGVYFRDDFAFTGGPEAYYYVPDLRICEYQSKLEEQISRLSSILTNPKSEIERKIGNTLRIFGVQVSIGNAPVRFVLLVTCLESLLSTDDRDYLGWKLAEKTAFILNRNRRICFKGIRDAYNKRSDYIHGNPRTNITKSDVDAMQATVVAVLKELVEFASSGHTKMKEFDEFVEIAKFGE